jgi:hypothetical protein
MTGGRIVAAMDETSPRSPRNHRVPSPLQMALNREWRGRYAAGLVAAPESWQTDPCLCRYRLAGEPLAEMTAAETPAERAEEIAEALAWAAAGGDDVAARVMVQYMLPRLVVAAWGGGLSGGSKEGEECDDLDTMISTVWLALATGEALRGDVGVWTRLLRDAEYLVLQRPRRRRLLEERALARVMVCDLADIAGRPESVGVPPAEELLEVVCEAVTDGLDLADAQLLTQLGVAGVAVAEAARADPAQVTSRCVRWRRARAVRRVRTLTAEAA